ncbi:MAG: nitrous oxide reductase accessory protein NosL [Saprospiraceae bacterium]|nr:nitrous oxide reductase accessory protein NosL [Saprospiraceae bacterium]
MACSPKPRPIDFGLDQCHFCKMSIVDAQFAAEWVTKKGRVYKYDAIECLARQLSKAQQLSSYELVCNYLSPGEWIEVSEATFLISPKIPSPMGGYLSAFASLAEAQAVQTQNGGELFTWHQILVKFNDSNAVVQ